MSFSWESLPLLSISWNFERGFVDSWCVFLENLFLCYLISWIFEPGFIGSWCVFLQLGLLTFVKFDFVRRWKSPGSSNARWLMLPRVRLPAVSLGRWRRLSMSSRSDFRYRMHFFVFFRSITLWFLFFGFLIIDYSNAVVLVYFEHFCGASNGLQFKSWIIFNIVLCAAMHEGCSYRIQGCVRISQHLIRKLLFDLL